MSDWTYLRSLLLQDVDDWIEFGWGTTLIDSVAADTEISAQDWAEVSTTHGDDRTDSDLWVARCFARCLREQIENACDAQISEYIKRRDLALCAE